MSRKIEYTPANLFQAVITRETFRRKEASGELEKEIKERAAQKTAELFPPEKMEKVNKEISELLDQFKASVLA